MLTNTIPFEQFLLNFGLDVWWIAAFFIVVSLWTVVWKGWALWLAARRAEQWWFVILLVVNTVGILEIIYIFFVAKQTDQKINL